MGTNREGEPRRGKVDDLGGLRAYSEAERVALAPVLAVFSKALLMQLADAVEDRIVFRASSHPFRFEERNRA